MVLCVSLISQISKILYNIFLVVGHLAIYITYDATQHKSYKTIQGQTIELSMHVKFAKQNHVFTGIHYPSRPTRAQAPTSRTISACTTIRATVMCKAAAAHSWPSGQWWRAWLARGHQGVRDNNEGSPKPD